MKILRIILEGIPEATIKKLIAFLEEHSIEFEVFDLEEL